MAMCNGKRKCIRCVAIGSILLGMVLLMAGCWSTKEPPTDDEVEGYLRDRYGEKFKVIEQKKMRGDGKYYEIQAYEVCPISDPEVKFSTFYLEYENSLGGAIIPERGSRMDTYYAHGIVRKEILDWLDREGWNYKVHYNCEYSFKSNREEEEQYATGMDIEIQVEDIESSREKVAEQLSRVLEDLIASYADKAVRIDNETDYDIRIELCEDGIRKYKESVWIMGIGSEELDISKEGIVEKFKSRRASPTSDEIEDELNKLYWWEYFEVREDLCQGLDAYGDYVEIRAYPVYSLKNAEIEFYTYYTRTVYRQGVPAEYSENIRSYYGETVVQEEIKNWLEREGWNYTVEYRSRYTSNQREVERYATGMSIEIMVEDIERDREKVAEQLSAVLEDLIASYADKDGLIENGKDYDIQIGLRLEGEDSSKEFIWLIGRKGELDISKEGLIEEFKKDINQK